jgi:hypothetical protein
MYSYSFKSVYIILHDFFFFIYYMIIIIISIIICIFCLSFSGILLYNLKKMYDNIEKFNIKYNMNYYPKEKKVYTVTDLDKLNIAYAIVQDNVVSENVTVNDKNITVYKGYINYPMGDFFSGKNYGKIYVSASENGIHGNVVFIKPTSTTRTSEKIYDVTCPIITMKPIKKDDLIKVYYDPFKQTAPPFIDPNYIINL